MTEIGRRWRSIQRRAKDKQVLPVDRIGEAEWQFAGYLFLNGFAVTGYSMEYGDDGSWKMRLEGDLNGQSIVAYGSGCDSPPRALLALRRGDAVWMIAKPNPEDSSLKIHLVGGAALKRNEEPSE